MKVYIIETLLFNFFIIIIFTKIILFIRKTLKKLY
jgi:hypothetical protein